eukprot:9627657-Alexandrium_andersonii.AAC.1
MLVCPCGLARKPARGNFPRMRTRNSACDPRGADCKDLFAITRKAPSRTLRHALPRACLLYTSPSPRD